MISSPLREVYRDSFYEFSAAAWPILEPSRPWRPTWYRQAIAEHLQAMWQGAFNRLIIMVPPQSGKSTFVSRLFPVWCWIQDPSVRAIFASYSFESLAVPMSVERRRIMESAWFQSLWSRDFSLSVDDNLKWRYSNNRGGHHIAVTGATGIGADLLVVDDPHSADEARSEAERTGTIKRFRETLITRLTPSGRNLCVIVCQRLHERDLAGELIEEGGWRSLCLDSGPLDAEQSVPLPISGKLVARQAGDLLDPVAMPREFLELKKIELGPSGYSAQYRQSPAPAEGIIFNPAWWKRHKGEPEREFTLVSVDANFKENRDAVAIHVWGFRRAEASLVAKTSQPMGYIRSKEIIRAYVSAYKPNVVLIEEAANGAAIVEELRSEFPVVGVSPLGSKGARADACSPQVAAGLVSIPEGPMGDQFVRDAAKFPLGRNDHDVDAMSQALNWRRQNAFGLLEYYRELAAKRLARDHEEERRDPVQVKAMQDASQASWPKGMPLGVEACRKCGRTGSETQHGPGGSITRCRFCGAISQGLRRAENQCAAGLR